MKVLIACEFSGTVRDAFAARGHEAMSCDLLPSEKPGKHYQGDVRDVLKDGWDLMIAHPPCTYLTCAGNRWFKPEYAARYPDRPKQRADALDFVRLLMDAPIPKIALENPIGIISSAVRKPDQIVNPWQFGDAAHKPTCLWLKGLPKLTATGIVDRGEFVTFSSGKKMPKWYCDAKTGDQSKTALLRSKTFQGIANAMADQWGGKHADS